MRSVCLNHQQFKGRANIEYYVTPCQWRPVTLRLIDSWNRVLMGSVDGSQLFLFALSSALLLPSPVNSSTLHELGAGERRWDERQRERERWVGELDWATLSSVDLLHWSCPSARTLNSTHTHTHRYEKILPRASTYTLAKMLRSSLESLVKALKRSRQQSPTAL